MAGRRSQPESESLELFLDTICNVFGGIIFIAMLIALLTAVDARMVPEQFGLEPGELRQVEDHRRDRASLLQTIDELEDSYQELVALNVLLDSSEEADEMHRRATQVVSGLEEAELRLRRLMEVKDQWKDKADEVASTVDERLRRTIELRDRITHVEAELDDIRVQRTIEARTPVQRRTRKSPIHVIMSRGKAHMVYRYARVGARAVAQGVEERDVEMTRLSAEAHRFDCRPDGGYPINDALESHPRWRDMIRVLNQQRDFLYIMVHPDSYEAFLLTKAAALRAGFEYEVVPVPVGAPVVLVPADEFTVQ